MTSEQIITLLGRPLTDADIEQILNRYKIRRRPQVEWDEEDADGPVVETKDWIVNRRMGIDFGFEDEASFLGRGAAQHGVGPMLLTQIYFYGDHEEVQPYRGPLPFGLNVDDDRKAVRAKLATWEGTRRSYERDTWELPEFRMTISYVDDGKRIGFVLCLLRPPAMACVDDWALLPKIHEILGVLGEPLNDHQFQSVFSSLDVKRRLEDRGEGKFANFRESYGIELQFGSENVSSGDLVFSNVLFYGDREAEACGWPGLLPLGLTFDDSPDVLFGKIGQPPDGLTDETFVGYSLWHLPDYSIQVKYSTIENCILCVHVMAPGVWDAY